MTRERRPQRAYLGPAEFSLLGSEADGQPRTVSVHHHAVIRSFLKMGLVGLESREQGRDRGQGEWMCGKGQQDAD
jgi:hypothetical protein